MTDLITYYDDATGERSGLAAAEVGAWSAATAALLTSGCGVRAGGRAAALLPPHWQTAVILLGSWAAGVEVSFRRWSTAGLTPAGEPLDVTFVEHRRIGNWLDQVPPAPHQFAVGPGAEVPPGYRDYLHEVRAYLGSAPPASLAGGQDAATVDGTTHAEYGALAAEIAVRRGIRRGDRVLVDTAAHEEPLIWLLAPLAAGAAIVLCANLDRSGLDRRIAQEHITHVL